MKYSRNILWLVLFVLSSATGAAESPFIFMSFQRDSCAADTERCIKCAVNLKHKKQTEELQSLLSQAIYNDMEGCVAHLITMGIDPDDFSGTGLPYTPLTLAAKFNARSVVSHLVAAGADPDKPDSFGVLPVIAAISSGNCAIIPLLFGRGGTPNPPVKYRQHKLKAFSIAMLENRFECARELTRLGVDINQRINGEREDMNGHTPLTLCLLSNHMTLARQFVDELNADTEARDLKGNTALLVMAKVGHMEAAKFLTEELGADISAENARKQNAINIAYSYDNKELAQYLEEYQRNQTLLYWLIRTHELIRETTWEEKITYTVSTLALVAIPGTLLLTCCRRRCH